MSLFGTLLSVLLVSCHLHSLAPESVASGRHFEDAAAGQNAQCSIQPSSFYKLKMAHRRKLQFV